MIKNRIQILNEALYSLGMLQSSVHALGSNDELYLAGDLGLIKDKLESLKSNEPKPDLSKMV